MIELYPFQRDHANKIYKSLRAHGVAKDASGTGTGKTVVATAVAEHIDYPHIVVVCPKAVIAPWLEWLDASRYTSDQYDVVNYEMLRTGKLTHIARRLPRVRKGAPDFFEWKIPPTSLVIFDEDHYCKGRDTLNGALMKGARRTNSVLCLGATSFTSPLEMDALGYTLGLHKGGKDYWRWAYDHGVRKGPFGMEFSGQRDHLEKISSDIFKDRGSLMRASDPEVAKFFNNNIVSADAYTVTEAEQIQRAYATLASVGGLDEKMQYDAPNALTESLRARQRVELYKVPVFVNLAQDAIENGYSPVVFVNFRDTLEEIRSALVDGDCPVHQIHGGDTQTERDLAVKRFQEPGQSAMLATISAGGVGISLHDTHGGFPRQSIVSPTYSATQFLQALGRIHRAGGKSPAVQKIVYAARTVEEKVCLSIKRKLRNLSTLTNTDLQPL